MTNAIKKTRFELGATDPQPGQKIFIIHFGGQEGCEIKEPATWVGWDKYGKPWRTDPDYGGHCKSGTATHWEPRD